MTLLNPGAVGRILHLSTSRVIQLDREGILPALRDAAGRRFYMSEPVEAFARQREQARHSATSAEIELSEAAAS